MTPGFASTTGRVNSSFIEMENYRENTFRVENQEFSLGPVKV